MVKQDCRIELFWYTGFKGKLERQFRPEGLDHAKKILQLRDRLLTFGGEQACMPAYEVDLDKIMLRGQLWYGDRIYKTRGDACRCHQNSCLLWESNKDNPKSRVYVATGYALSEDGMWRQHSWCIQVRTRINRVLETTVKRVAYFGVVLTDEEAKEMLENQF